MDETKTGPVTRDQFDAEVERFGLQLSPEERDGVFKTARWMSEGVAALPLGDALENEAEETPGEDPAGLTIMEAGTRLRDGRLTAVALVKAHLKRIAERDGVYGAFYHVDAERALAAAAEADRELRSGLDRGPLHGIPVGIKDLIDVAGLPTTAGSKGRADGVATSNATVVQRLVDAGAIILGKLATYEYGTVGPAYDTLFPPAKNPWNVDHITGGSSSGCAVAVAGGLLRTTVGSDTGGSVRGPAAYCGVVGLKPTYGLVPKDGAIGLAPSMDHLGPMSATTAEAALTLDIMSGRLSTDGAASRLGQPIAGLRIGYARNWFAHDPQMSPAILRAMDDAVSELSLLGALIEEVELPDYPPLEAVAAAILQKEAFDLMKDELAGHPEHFGRKTYQNLVSGVALTDEEVSAARRAAAEFRRSLDRDVFSRFDAVITVCALTTALPVSLFGKEAVWTPMRTIGFNLSGNPVLALPIGFDDGLPMGMQIIGRHGDEATICQIGDAFEQQTGHSDQHPPAPRHS